LKVTSPPQNSGFEVYSCLLNKRYRLTKKEK
jgi:hypothetical protein